MSPDLKRKYEITRAEDTYEIATAVRDIGDKQAGSIPIEIAVGSGLALAATITTMKDTKIETIVEVSTDSTDLAAPIATVIDLAVV